MGPEMTEFTKADVGHDKYRRLIKAAQALPVIKVAVAKINGTVEGKIDVSNPDAERR